VKPSALSMGQVILRNVTITFQPPISNYSFITQIWVIWLLIVWTNQIWDLTRGIGYMMKKHVLKKWILEISTNFYICISIGIFRMKLRKNPSTCTKSKLYTNRLVRVSRWCIYGWLVSYMITWKVMTTIGVG